MKKQIKLNNITVKLLKDIIKNGYTADGKEYIIIDCDYSEDYYKKGKGIGSKNTRYCVLEEK